MKSLLAAIAFCTRIPISVAFGAEDIGRASRWFPLVGALLGAVSIAISRLLLPYFPAIVVAVLILITEVLLTGAIHTDGLADTADGFGGGKSRDDTLRIMRDHTIGSYGGTALILLFMLKAAAIATIIARNWYSPYLILAPAIGRWVVVLLSYWLPYARTSEAVSRHIGTREIVWATLFTAAITTAGITLGAARWQGAVCWGLTAVAAGLFGQYCRRKIGGVTGDTLGASEQIGESIVLLAGIVLG